MCWLVIFPTEKKIHPDSRYMPTQLSYQKSKRLKTSEQESHSALISIQATQQMTAAFKHMHIHHLVFFNSF